MYALNEEETAQYLDEADIVETLQREFAVINIGCRFGIKFVMINNCFGETVVTEGL